MLNVGMVGRYNSVCNSSGCVKQPLGAVTGRNVRFSVFKLGGKTLAVNITEPANLVYLPVISPNFLRLQRSTFPEKVLDCPAVQAATGSFQAGQVVLRGPVARRAAR